MPSVVLGAARRRARRRGDARRRAAARAGARSSRRSVGIAGAYAATHSGVAHLETSSSWGALIAAMLRYATPLTFAALGGLVSERSGVVNIAPRGHDADGRVLRRLGRRQDRLVGARRCSSACSPAWRSRPSTRSSRSSLRADQIVSGTALNFLAVGITGYLYVDIYGDQGTPDDLPARAGRQPADRLARLHRPGDRPAEPAGVGRAGGGAVVWVVVFRTPRGLRLRSVGENPRAAETVGIGVLARAMSR